MMPDAPPLPARRSWFGPVVRVLLAVGVTLAVLPYFWGRTLVMTLMNGFPHPVFLAGTVLGMAVVFFLSRNQAEHCPPALRRGLPWLLGAGWLTVGGVLIGLFARGSVPRLVVVPLFLSATLWVPWVAWLGFSRLPWGKWLGTCVLLLLAQLGLLIPLQVRGLTGDALLDFAWRFEPGPTEAVSLPADVAPVSIDLARTTDHDYPQFLGPRRLGDLPLARIAGAWLEPPRLMWRRPVGAAWSAFAVVGDYAVTQEQRGDDECVVCYRVADGAVMWLHADPVQIDYLRMGGLGPRATPTIDRGRVYTVGATGLLNCLDGATGRVLWSVNILRDHGARNVAHGVCASPLVVDDLVIVCPTGEDGRSLAAYHRDTGQRVWHGGQDRAGYGSPLLAHLGGLRQILVFNSEAVAGHDLATGQVLWRFPWTNGERVNCSQPIPNAGAPDQVFVSTGYGAGCALFRVERAADGSWLTQTLWQNRHLKTKFTTAVLYQGCVYGLDDGILACLELATGKRRWKSGRYGHGQILLAGDRLIVQAEHGDVVLVEPSPDGLRERGKVAALSGKTWNNPALSGRYLLVRNAEEAACYELPESGPPP